MCSGAPAVNLCPPAVNASSAASSMPVRMTSAPKTLLDTMIAICVSDGCGGEGQGTGSDGSDVV